MSAMFFLQDLSSHQKIKEEISEKKTTAKKKDEKKSDISKAIKPSEKVSKIKEMSKKFKKQKDYIKQPQHQSKSSVLDYGEKITEAGIDQGKQNVRPLEPWSLGPFHNKIRIHKHHASKTEQ